MTAWFRSPATVRNFLLQKSQYFNNSIFSSGVHKIFELSNYKTEFADAGIDYYEIGLTFNADFAVAVQTFDALNSVSGNKTA